METTNTMGRNSYTMPSIEIIHFQVEQGFVGSTANTESMPEDEVQTF
ncbi:MAG: hypothetical protein RRY73_05485 [Alistipes sp.]